MKNRIKKAKYGCTILSGMICGIISTFWCGLSILTACNLIEDPGSYHYEEAETFRPYGIIGLIIYVICLGCLFLCFKKKKISFPAFLLPMLLGVLSTCIYIYFK